MMLEERDILEELYDLSNDASTEMPDLNDDLTPEEEAEAEFFNQLRMGLMLVTGDPGSGKNTWMFYLLWKLKTLFKGFKVLLDKKPRMLFGPYIPFNETMVVTEFQKLNDKYKGVESEAEIDFAENSQNKEMLNKIIREWMGNDELFGNAGMGLDEFWRYFYNRDPHNPMNRAISPLFKRYRHYPLLVIGNTPHKDELDIKSCLKYVTHEVRCTQTGIPGEHIYLIYTTKWREGQQILEMTSSYPTIIQVNALKPRERLDGKCIHFHWPDVLKCTAPPKVLNYC